MKPFLLSIFESIEYLWAERETRRAQSTWGRVTIDAGPAWCRHAFAWKGMYVIFPADEIILLSYGIAQNPRFQPRPTLDNLKEPIVPSTGIRPSTNSNLDVYSNLNSSSRRNSNQLRSSINSHSSVKRDPSPNVSFADDFMSKSRLSVVEDSFRTDDTLSSSNITLDGSKKKSKLKSKFSKISLGKLGRPSSNEQVEPPSARLREDLKLRVSNPTFTHDNLREKNFDAFFASGEPVYSLERKKEQSDLSDSSLLTPLTPLSLATTIDTPSSFAPSPTTPTSISSDRPRKNSIAALFSSRFTSKQPSSTNSSSGKRPKSAELYRSTEGSVKGDRCPIHRFWWIKDFVCACAWVWLEWFWFFCLSFLFKSVSMQCFIMVWTNEWILN